MFLSVRECFGAEAEGEIRPVGQQQPRLRVFLKHVRPSRSRLLSFVLRQPGGAASDPERTFGRE
jgi:hypothetical protein